MSTTCFSGDREPALPIPLRGNVVIDTNCVLDLWVFQDPGVAPLHAALAAGRLCWRATPGMRDELARVLGYPRIVPRLVRAGRTADEVLRSFDGVTCIEPAAAHAPVRCRDPDDQPFIDLAVHWRATLLSKDARVFGLARRLAPLGVTVRRAWLDDEMTPAAPGMTE
ncbi:MAG: PIN domain-containing protein [Pseudomonadota bacterium]|nr:PIN domain-containing protein [Pseudomonadota bacterium]